MPNRTSNIIVGSIDFILISTYQDVCELMQSHLNVFSLTQSKKIWAEIDKSCNRPKNTKLNKQGPDHDALGRSSYRADTPLQEVRVNN